MSAILFSMAGRATSAILPDVSAGKPRGERSRTRCLPSAPQNDLLPRTADSDKVQARYTVGCLTISVGKREALKPRAITVQ